MPPAPTGGVVVVTYGGYATEDPQSGGALLDAGLRLRSSPRSDNRTPQELAAIVADAVAVIADADPFDEFVLAGAPHLRVIARTGVGLDSIDLDAATRAGVVVTITPGTNHETVADHTLALMLAALRRLRRLDAAVRAGGWRDFSLPLAQLHGATVGLIGYGAIGRAVGERVRGFGASLLIHDPLAAEHVELETLLQTSDVVSLHLPLAPETRHFLNAERIGLLRPGAVVVNTARGPVIDQAALVAALRSGHVGAAGLDVFEAEPPGIGPLSELDNVVLSPHVGGISDASNLAMSRMATASVLAALAGTPAGEIVNPTVLAGR